MRFPWQRRKPGPTGGEIARKKAERDLQAVREETPRYEALASSLRQMVRDNHLGEALTNAFREGK